MTYLFDIGNVLLSFDFLPALNSLIGKNATPDAVDQLLLKKDSFESGKINTTEYVLLARKLLDYQGSDEHFFNTWNSIFTKIPKTFDLAKSLKEEGHRLILFSNISPIHAHYCLNTYNLMGIFDDAVLSYEIGAIKPEDSFYTRAFDKYDIIPKKSIYIDDLPQNIATGKKHGLRSFCYNQYQHNDLLVWLKTQKLT